MPIPISAALEASVKTDSYLPYVRDFPYGHTSSRQFSRPDAAVTAASATRSLAPPTFMRGLSTPTPSISVESSIASNPVGVRSSSETTAATIFSMYGEDRNRSSSVDISSVARPSTLHKKLPIVPDSAFLSPEAVEHVSRSPSIRFNAAAEITDPPTTSVAVTLPQGESSLLPPSPRVTMSSQSSPHTISRSSSQAYSVQAPDEDDDCYHVRATYARLDYEGVPGDGYQEGVERTRTRKAASTYTVRGEDQTGTGGLSQKEAEVLKSLDRYGFHMVSEPHYEARLAVLPASPLKKALSRVKLSSRSAPPSPPEMHSTPKLRNSPRDKEAERIDKWDRMMRVSRRDDGGNIAAWVLDGRKGRKLRLRLYKGVPDRWRGAAWWSVIEGDIQRGPPRPSRPTAEQLQRRYWDLINQPSTFDIQIDLDVPRTITGHVFFHTRYGLGQRSLFHVLHSFSLLCSDCGYVQGMGPIAATLLCYLQPERAYSCMVRLHDDFQMHSMFQPGFPGLLENLYVQERIMERMLPDVYTSFSKNMISSTAYATKWYITLFANVVPFQTQLRIWDAFFYEGRDLMVIVATSILWVLRDYLASPEATFETILSLLSSYFVPQDEDAMMTWIRRSLEDENLRADMTRWRSEWSGLVAKGESGKALL